MRRLYNAMPEDLKVIAAALKLHILVLLLILGGLAGLVIRETAFIKYEAQFSLPLGGDIALFREIELGLGSSSIWRNFGAASGLADDEEFKRIQEQLDRGTNPPAEIVHQFRVSRGDVRDVPDAARESFSRQLGSVLSDVRITASWSNPESATQIAMLMMRFVRESLTAASLKSMFASWGSGERITLSKSRESIARGKSTIVSLDRQIAGMEAIRDRFKDEKDIVASQTSGLQVQVSGVHNLSPLQQIIGLHADRVAALEKVKLAEEDTARSIALIAIADEFGPRLSNSSAILLAREIQDRIKLQASEVGDEDQANAVEQARASVAVQVATALARFDEVKTEPIAPIVRRAGLRRTISILIGMIFGGALWLASVGYLLQRSTAALKA